METLNNQTRIALAEKLGWTAYQATSIGEKCVYGFPPNTPEGQRTLLSRYYQPLPNFAKWDDGAELLVAQAESEGWHWEAQSEIEGVWFCFFKWSKEAGTTKFANSAPTLPLAIVAAACKLWLSPKLDTSANPR